MILVIVKLIYFLITGMLIFWIMSWAGLRIPPQFSLAWFLALSIHCGIGYLFLYVVESLKLYRSSMDRSRIVYPHRAGLEESGERSGVESSVDKLDVRRRKF